MNQIVRYYRILGLEPGARIDDIKKAYRRCAQKYHPDLNKSPSAVEFFIESTEAYQFLLAYHRRKSSATIENSTLIQEWERNKKEQARRTAYAHARKRYNNFVNSDLYKSTRILDKTRFYIGIIVALLIIILAINGYIGRLKMVDMGFEKPTLAGFLFLIFIGLLFLAVSLLYLYNYYSKYKK